MYCNAQSSPRLTDVVEGPCAEFSIEVLGSQGPEVVDGVGPEVEHVVPGEGVPLLDHNHLAAQQGQLDGGPQAARPPAHDQTLRAQEAGGGQSGSSTVDGHVWHKDRQSNNS